MTAKSVLPIAHHKALGAFMKKIIIAVGAFLALSGTAYARCDQYGNCYSGGYGSNLNTGSQWNSRSSGSTTYGTDSRGNSWSYNRSSGQYQNYGTGETRYRGQRY
jgi:hypothetical protein